MSGSIQILVKIDIPQIHVGPEDKDPRQGPCRTTPRPPASLAGDDHWAAARPAPGKGSPPRHHSSAMIGRPTKQAPAWRHADLRGSLPLRQHSSWLASVVLHASSSRTRGEARKNGGG